ncbi:MAG: hypothetical protein EB023_14470 [Flavobacteriia bacterium]|nr:hypothetical protein [Flavobacteriia bacterium]
MAAKDNLQWEQLAMFMPAHKLAMYSSQDAIENDNFIDKEDSIREHGPFGDTAMYASKADDLHDRDYYDEQDYATTEHDTLYDDLDTHGIQEPITLTHYGKYHGNKNRKKHPEQTKTLITEGHHRLAYALETDWNMELPVEHVDPNLK